MSARPQPGDPDFPYMLADTPEEFERVRRAAWPMTALPLEPHTEADRRIADIEAAPYAPESAVERVARAMWEAQSGAVPWDELSPRTPTRTTWRRYALVAIGAMKGPGLEAEALARVEALADEYGWVGGSLQAQHVADGIRTALAEMQTGQRTTDEERA